MANQVVVRWSPDLNELLDQAWDSPADPPNLKKLMAQAVRRCLPQAHDPIPGRTIDRARNIRIAFPYVYSRVHNLLAARKALGDDFASTSANHIFVEALARYLYFRAGHFGLKPELIKSTGYTDDSPPPQIHHDRVHDVELQLVREPWDADVKKLLDDPKAESPHSINHLCQDAQQDYKELFDLNAGGRILAVSAVAKSYCKNLGITGLSPKFEAYEFPTPESASGNKAAIVLEKFNTYKSAGYRHNGD